MARVSSSSLLKNLEMESFRTRRSLLGRRGGVGCNFLAWCWVPPDAGWLSGKQFWNADQVIGNQIEQEVGGDASDATMFGLAHGAMLLAPSKNALDLARRDCDMPYPGCRVVRSSMALLRVLPVLVAARSCSGIELDDCPHCPGWPSPASSLVCKRCTSTDPTAGYDHRSLGAVRATARCWPRFLTEVAMT
jgi:hypothetical protein